MQVILYFFSIVMIVLVVLPMFKKDFWVFRVFDYPRLQKFTIIAVLCLCWMYFLEWDVFGFDYYLVLVLLVCLLHLGFLVYPFTPFGRKMIEKVKRNGSPTLDILVSNVYQKNRQYSKLLELIKRRNPDIVFLLETDQLWRDNLKGLRDDFPHSIEVPKNNTYGLLFYSKLPITDFTVNYLIDDEIPSISATVSFDGQAVKIFGLHPTPPVPQENDHSTDRDAEILLVGKMAKKVTGPCIVIGDLNDVAWSYTTELFLKTSGLLDPRRGRGLYSTFHAKYPILRWPLDHFFVSGHFRLVGMKVENNIGSDHFPISICLLIAHQNDKNALDIDAGEKKLVNQKIDAGQNGDPR